MMITSAVISGILNTNNGVKKMKLKADKTMFRTILAIISSGIWIIISEAFRNQFLLKKFWLEQYNKVGFHVAEGLSSSSKLLFAAWVLILSVIIYILLKKFVTIQYPI